ncbi:MAG: SUMF1/EgtB/PvdO family nonheme iron enzyme [Lentisphaeria bacterium]|nr:SUMF1/EgtB/PvdO family nonheme iron enzyme [Lentisphaeria bacterium]
MITKISVGDTFSGCKIIAQCGKGAYGEVFLALNALDQKIVIKIVQHAENFNRERRGLQNYMQIAGKHPHLLQVFHIGALPDGFYYTIEAADDLNDGAGSYCPATLGNMLRQGKIFTPEEALHILRQLLDGVMVIHQAELVHRDIKPDNIIFVNGKAKLSDPGLITPTGQLATFAGTPGFIPPENIAKDLPVTSQTDLYALGKVFYCMLTGNPPGDFPHLPEDMRLEISRQMFPILARSCNTNPAKRFKSAEDFRNFLPENLTPPNWWEKQRTAFRDWKSLNQEKFRFIKICTITLCCLLLAGGVTAGILRNIHLKKIEAFKQDSLAFQAINKERKELIALQLESDRPDLLDQYKILDEKISSLSKSNNWAECAAICKKLHNILQDAAEKIMPAIPDKMSSDADNFKFTGKAYGFLSSPLASYLPEKQLREYKTKLRAFDRKFYDNWAGPQCGREWNNFDNFGWPMVFVPPGTVKMRHSKKTVKIPYHFWICKEETGHDHFSNMTGIAPQHSPHSRTPVERVVWNDALLYCYTVTRSMMNHKTLPPGYIVRMPLEQEWEYAAQNGWLGADTTPLTDRAVLKANSGYRSMPPGSKPANKLGINDMFGNVAEMMHPFEEPAMKHSYMVRGGSYMSAPEWCFKQLHALKYQNIPYDIGFRVVLAPGTMDYFDKHFFLGGPDQLRSHGRVFELLGENRGSFNWEESNQLCQLLGGKLAELDHPDLLEIVKQKMPLANMTWGCVLGGHKIHGQWQWISSGKKIDFGKWKISRDKSGKYLVLKSDFWQDFTPNIPSAIFLCQWDEKEFPNRNKHLKSGKKLPMELLRFTIGDRKFMLINSSAGWYTAKRICELLGGRLACLDTPELQQQVIKKLESYSNNKILLGGYIKRTTWYWLSGKKITFDLKVPKSMTIPTVNKNFVVLKNGEFYNEKYSHLFLCEWAESIASSN